MPSYYFFLSCDICISSDHSIRFHHEVSFIASRAEATAYHRRAWRRVRHPCRFGYRSARYEANGNVAEIQDVKNVVTRASYNAIGQRSSVSDPNQGAWSFVYNALGEVTSQTDARGIVIALTYDALGRPTTRHATVDVTDDSVADSE